ncbi:MAG: hypothetical protein GEV09_18025 [Pseudonocardiaceae bacterium]|nr:hypothetical protein [Pseudonocardiaceae bacterium]
MGTRNKATVVAGTVALLFGAGASFGAGSAAAASLAECGGTVEGSPGEAVTVNPAALLGAGPDKAITVGNVPSSGSTTLDVTSALGGVLGPLAPACTVVVEAIEPVTEPVREAAEPVTKAVEDVAGPLPGLPAPEPNQPAPEPNQPAPQPNQPAPQPESQPAPAAAPVPAPQFGPFMPADFDMGPLQRGVYDFSSLSLYDYRELFSAGVGEFGRLPSSNLFGNSELFGQAPQFGILGAAQDSAAADVAAAGRAHALPAEGVDRVALPVLVAVMMLSGVTAAMVRSWMVRPKKA